MCFLTARPVSHKFCHVLVFLWRDYFMFSSTGASGRVWQLRNCPGAFLKRCLLQDMTFNLAFLILLAGTNGWGKPCDFVIFFHKRAGDFGFHTPTYFCPKIPIFDHKINRHFTKEGRGRRVTILWSNFTKKSFILIRF